jgi:hypothetical protein
MSHLAIDNGNDAFSSAFAVSQTTQMQTFPTQLRFPNSGHSFMSIERPVSSGRKRAASVGSRS